MTSEADQLIADLEARGLGWSLDHTGHLIEVRIWDWPNVIGRYRPATVEPLAKMLVEAMVQLDWRRYPAKNPPLGPQKPPKSVTRRPNRQ